MGEGIVVPEDVMEVLAKAHHKREYNVLVPPEQLSDFLLGLVKEGSMRDFKVDYWADENAFMVTFHIWSDEVDIT
jgi:hypothetical protein